MKKVFISDIDGTLVTFKGKNVSEKNIKTINENRNSFYFVFATGLPEGSYVDNILKKVDPDFVIYSAGAVLVDKSNDNVIFEKKIVKEEFDSLKKIINDQKIFFTNVNRTKYFYLHDLTIDDEKIISKFRDKYNSTFEKINEENFEEIFKSRHRIHIMTSKEKINIITSEMENLKNTKYFEDSTGMILNITHKDSTKRMALIKLSEYLNIDFGNDAVAIGDSKLDEEMLLLASISMTLEDSSEYIKKIADYVVPASDKDGVSEAIKLSKKLMYN